jgi:hypothetical protein
MELFFNGKFGGLGPPSVDWTAWLWSMMDRDDADKRVGWCHVGVWRAGARAHRWSPVAVDGGEPDEAVMEGCSLEHGRRWRGYVMVKKTSSGLSSVRG